MFVLSLDTVFKIEFAVMAGFFSMLIRMWALFGDLVSITGKRCLFLICFGVLM